MTQLFDRLVGHEQIVYGSDAASGLRCIIAIHSTALGPALGGTRFYPYADEDAALTDVLRLSRSMSFKAACAGLDLGGGKAVIIGNPAELKTERLLRAYGRIVESLRGRYVTACDIGTAPADMQQIARETRWATGRPAEFGGSGDSGVLTAYGVFVGMKATARRLWGDDDLAGKHVAVQGLGKVGRRVVGHLIDVGARVTVADVNADAVAAAQAAHGVAAVAPDAIITLDADILSPNAMGAVLSATTIPDLKVAAVCGGANNQLARDTDAELLRTRGIVYAPDYVVNAGGLISVAGELAPDGYHEGRCHAQAEGIGTTLAEIFALADERDVTTEIAAEQVAELRMSRVGGLRAFHLP